MWDSHAPVGTGTLGMALLTPTALYVKACLAALREGGVHAMAHITGGGLTENLPRVLPDDLGAAIDLERIPALPIMAWLAQAGGISEAEMLKTFNCGIGMILAVEPTQVATVEAALSTQGMSSVRLGEVISGQGVSYMGQLPF